MHHNRRRCDMVSGCGVVYSRTLSRCPACGLSEEFSDAVLTDMRDYVYDLETYPNIITFAFKHVATGQRWLFEISDRRNDFAHLWQFVHQLKQVGARLVGFNNQQFDYPILHWVMTCGYQPAAIDIYNKAQEVIRNQDDEGAFASIVQDYKQLVPQVDLFKIHHFDNRARATGLKVLEFNMDSDNIEDLPFPFGTYLTHEQKDVLISYNQHDVDETEKFYHKSAEMIEFREQLSAKYQRNFINHNDTKIGKDYFIMRLEEQSPGCCYGKDEAGRRVTRQTVRQSIRLADAVFKYVKFEQSEFQRIHAYFLAQTITETKGVFENLTASVGGFTYVFGAGGIHGSVDSCTVVADDEFEIVDVDVKSYYPRMGIVNRVHPAHLGQVFCDIYANVYDMRTQYAKGTPENAMLKLALNGIYGDSNNQYSPFYDPLYTMTITINGQLLLCMLAEQLIKIPGLSVIQVNTDGITVRSPRKHKEHFRAVCKWWQDFTCLELEYADYSRMFIRDVNNYIAENVSGKIKRKGAYEYTGVADGKTEGLQWHQNHSARIIARAAEAALLDDEDIGTFIRSHPIERDFHILAKVPRGSRLVMETSAGIIEQQRISRYYVSEAGGQLVKIMPPLKGKTGDRHFKIEAGWNSTVINRRQPLHRVNYKYYIQEAEKLVNPLRPKQRSLL